MSAWPSAALSLQLHFALNRRGAHWLAVRQLRRGCRAARAAVETLFSQAIIASFHSLDPAAYLTFPVSRIEWTSCVTDIRMRNSYLVDIFSPHHVRTLTPDTMAAPPSIPPRPARAQNSSASSNLMDVPKIPPRPRRGADRSVSPHRDTYARSPLNDPSFIHNGQHKESHLSAEVPPRPPSVSLPSLGEEGMEYASLEDLSRTLTNQSESYPQQTKQVAGDLPLYAPTASVPSSTAKSRIQTVTRTDSSQAAAAGLGKLMPDEKSVYTDSGRSVSSHGGNTRPSSVYKDKDEDEHGIPEIGVQVPMYPNAGDVQAPTPSPYEQNRASSGIGFFNKEGQPTSRHHGRTKSGREIFHGPPGSYGRHGHGVIPKDEFEQQWYAKHPDDLKREKAGEYGPHIQENRKDYHWQSEKLEKLVHVAGAQGIGMGTLMMAVVPICG